MISGACHVRSCDSQNDLGVMVTQLDQLLLGVNPRTGLADHFINIARSLTHSHPHTFTPSHPHSYLSLTWETPELAVSAIKILVSASHSIKVAKEMAVAISNNKVLNQNTKSSVCTMLPKVRSVLSVAKKF